ncbi:hypothetical protein [Oceanimonas sp. GK1]|uniref:hypothetical protein n=1 Tax=Oceanimonas sp. (strain GK1 / IBRC-M 10197) TaxID=511062 RepID=UPI0011D26999|nr:hypothetical protein [Oceanimonas sp. GK1]
MSSKINVFHIVRGHFKSLHEGQGIAGILADYSTFLLVPFSFSLFGYFLDLKADNNIISLSVNFGAIFTALLMSVLVLVYDQESKLKEKMCEGGDDYSTYHSPMSGVRLKLMSQLYLNISYCIVVSISLVAVSALSLLYTSVPEPIKGKISFDLLEILFTPIMVFILSHLIFTILMVVKRIYALLVSN